MQLAFTPIDSGRAGLYHFATFGLTIDPNGTPYEFFATLPGNSWRAWRATDAIKEKFLNQRLLKAQVKMLPEPTRTGQGNFLLVQRADKSRGEASA